MNTTNHLPRNICWASLLFLIMITSGLSHGQSNAPSAISWYQNNNDVDIAYYKDTIFAGGKFSIIGSPTGHTIMIDAATGTVQKRDITLSYATVSISDGEGGWFAAMECENEGIVIHHIFETGDIDYNWQAFAVGQGVNAMALCGCQLFVGGGFSSIDGYGSPSLSALDAATGEVLEWNIEFSSLPGMGFSINTLTTSGTQLYIGGIFHTINGVIRNNIAAVDALTGELSPWNPNANGEVTKILTCKTGVYVAGKFTHIGDARRVHLASIDSHLGKATRWNPNPNGTVDTIAETRGVLYAQGSFTTIGGQTREGIAALNAFTGLAMDWNLPRLAPYDTRYYCDAENGVLYVVEKISRDYPMLSALSAYDITNCATPLWRKPMDETVSTMSISGNRLLVSGAFNCFGGSLRTCLAALDVNTGAVRDWTWTFGNYAGIERLFPAGNTLYIYGYDITSINNIPCKKIAAIDMDTGEVLDGQPAIDDSGVNVVCRVQDTLYLGGCFTSINGQLRNHIAAVDANTGELMPWNPNANHCVNSIITNGNTLYIGGYFTEIGGYACHGLAAYDLSTEKYLSWFPNCTSSEYNEIYDMKLYNNKLYVGGYNCLWSVVNLRTGMCHALSSDLNSDIHRLAIVDKTMYGSYVRSINGQSRNGIAAIDLTTEHVLPWNPEIFAQKMAPMENGICVWGNRIGYDRKEIMMFRNESSTEALFHSADSDRDGVISATEIGRVVGFYAAEGYHADESTEDGFAPGTGEKGGIAHDSDFLPADGIISPQELNRLITLYNAGGYVADDSSADGFAPVVSGK